MDSIRAWPHHIHQMHLCTTGARELAAALDLDYNEFVFRGLPVEQLRASGNAFAIALADFAEQEAQRGSEQ
jgi:hypothetical protein